MTRIATSSVRARFAGLACAALLAACGDTSLPTSATPTPDLAKLNGTNGFAYWSLAFNDDLLCAGAPDVWTEVGGYLKVASVHPRSGGGWRVTEIMSNGRVTLSANGKSLSSAISGQAFYDLDADGNLEQITFLGSNGNFSVPGQGRLAAEVGPLTIAADGTVTREQGQHDVFGANPDLAKLCAWLGN